MKYRTFLTTLVLFLVSINLGIFIISISTFRDTVQNAKDRSLGEHYFITSALLKDLHTVAGRGTNIEEVVGSLLQPYRYLSSDGKVQLALYRGDQRVYSDRVDVEVEERYLMPPDNGSRLVSLQESDGRTYVVVSGKLPEPYSLYKMVYVYDTTEAITAWRQTKNTLFGAGGVLSILFALGHLGLLHRVFKPLSQISQTSRNIASGDYETRLPVSGNDELSEMARSFNHMADEIRRQMKELVTAAENKQQFIDNFAHELRTPLTAIYGYAEYMQKASLSEEERLSAVSYIMSESRRMQTMANQLLELANLKNDQLVWEQHQVADLFRSVRQTMHSKLTEKTIQLWLHCGTEVLRGDGCLLKSLFVNLVDNAIKACGTGGSIVIHAAAEDGKIIVSVRDNGKGMDPETLRHITEPFYRGEKSRNRKDGGAGLGLAICRQIVERHGAELQFESQPGDGTIAKVIFYNSNIT